MAEKWIQEAISKPGALKKQEKPEFAVMHELIRRLDKPMNVDVEGGKVTVRKGDDTVTTGGSNV